MRNPKISTTLPHESLTMLTPAQLSECIGISVDMLSNWRQAGIGPSYVKFGTSAKARVRYPIEDVLAWKNSLPRSVQSVGQNAEAAHGS